MTRFTTLYPTAFPQRVDTDEKRADWMQVWGDVLDTMTPAQVGEAVKACTVAHKWPPTPAEFRALAVPEPDYEASFNDAAHARWTSSAVYWAAQRYGWADLRVTTFAKGGARFIRLLDEALADPALPEIPQHQALPKPTGTYSQEAAKAALVGAKAMLNAQPSQRWAEQIMAQIDAGEAVYSIAVTMACRALGRDPHTVRFTARTAKP